MTFGLTIILIGLLLLLAAHALNDGGNNDNIEPQ